MVVVKQVCASTVLTFYQFTSPARSLKLNAKPTVVDKTNGIYQYTVMAGCEKNQVKLEAFFNWQDKKTSLTFGLNGKLHAPRTRNVV